MHFKTGITIQFITSRLNFFLFDSSSCGLLSLLYKTNINLHLISFNYRSLQYMCIMYCQLVDLLQGVGSIIGAIMMGYIVAPTAPTRQAINAPNLHPVNFPADISLPRQITQQLTQLNHFKDYLWLLYNNLKPHVIKMNLSKYSVLLNLAGFPLNAQSTLRN